jgi:hypothetical protein
LTPPKAVALGDVVGGDLTRHITYVIQQPLDKLSKADPSNVQEIASSQIELLVVYHNVVLDQARRSFRWALVAAGVGFSFFLIAVGLLLFQQSQNVAVMSLISGSLIEVISAINFYLYGKTSTQLADFQARLETTQRFLLANSVCEGLDGDFKQQSRAELVRAIAGIRPILANAPPSPEKTESAG